MGGCNSVFDSRGALRKHRYLVALLGDHISRPSLKIFGQLQYKNIYFNYQRCTIYIVCTGEHTFQIATITISIWVFIQPWTPFQRLLWYIITGSVARLQVYFSPVFRSTVWAKQMLGSPYPRLVGLDVKKGDILLLKSFLQPLSCSKKFLEDSCYGNL